MGIWDLELTMTDAMLRLKGQDYTPWERKFIFLKKINEQWVFCRSVYRRREVGVYDHYDWAVNDLETLQKGVVVKEPRRMY